MIPFSAVDEIRKMARPEAVTLEDQPSLVLLGAEQWEMVSRNLSRMAKQQWRAIQEIEQLAKQSQEVSVDVRDQAHQHRREAIRLSDDARVGAVRLLAIIDMLDDIRTLVKQRGDNIWLQYVERLTTETLAAFEAVGLSEIVSLGRPLEATEHEPVGTQEGHASSTEFSVAEVLQRGFRHKGNILRRARVIINR
jgi:molecular chaperone GrpE (heat shock protein)